jgi:hypothetical protein
MRHTLLVECQQAWTKRWLILISEDSVLLRTKEQGAGYRYYICLAAVLTG